MLYSAHTYSYFYSEPGLKPEPDPTITRALPELYMSQELQEEKRNRCECSAAFQEMSFTSAGTHAIQKQRTRMRRT